MFYDQFMVLFQKIIKLFECGLQLESIGYDRTSLIRDTKRLNETYKQFYQNLKISDI
jgi:hypothetical protein